MSVDVQQGTQATAATAHMPAGTQPQPRRSLTSDSSASHRPLACWNVVFTKVLFPNNFILFFCWVLPPSSSSSPSPLRSTPTHTPRPSSCTVHTHVEETPSHTHKIATSVSGEGDVESTVWPSPGWFYFNEKLENSDTHLELERPGHPSVPAKVLSSGEKHWDGP